MRFQHHLKTLCKVLKVNRSSYYKHFSSKPANRVLENQEYRRIILEVYSDYDKCIGAYKLAYILKRDYGINISVGRVYRLMSSMNLPKKSTDRPVRAKHKDNGISIKISIKRLLILSGQVISLISEYSLNGTTCAL